jgi:hypothetical protein
MPSRKNKPDPWWFNLSYWDVVPSQKVNEQFNHALLAKITYAFINAKYPNRPKKVHDWMETFSIDGAKYMLSCHIDETNRKVVWKKVTSSNKPQKKRHT